MTMVTVVAVAVASVLGVVGCVPQSAYCLATIEFDGGKYCAAGVEIPPFGGVDRELQVGGQVESIPGSNQVRLGFGTFLRVGSHGLGGVSFTFTETSTGSLDGFDIGQHTLRADPDHPLSFRYSDDSDGGNGEVLTATSGSLRITKLVLAPDEGTGQRVFVRLSATFVVDTERGQLIGAVSIGHD